MTLRCVLAGLALFALAGAARAGTWTIDDARAQRGEEFVVGVAFAGDGTAVDAQFDVLVNPMYVVPVAAVGANGGDCAVLPPSSIDPDTVRILAPDYDGAPLDAGPTTFCFITYRVEDFPTQNVALLDLARYCVADSGASSSCSSTPGNLLVENLVAEPDIGGSIAIVGDAGTVNATRTLTVRNTATAASYVVGMCAMLPPSSGHRRRPARLERAAGRIARPRFNCTLPPAGTTISATSTASPTIPRSTRSAMLVTCTRRSATLGGPVPQDPIESPDTDAGDLFGTSVALTNAAPPTSSSSARRTAATAADRCSSTSVRRAIRSRRSR